ncbi:MAG: hypothetical protein ACR2QC_09820 [Gammaproteobacteria bacterium]
MTAANAQEAEAQVYTEPTATFVAGGNTVDLSDPLTTVVSDIIGAGRSGVLLGLYVSLLSPASGGTSPDNTIPADNLPTFGGVAVKRGDVLKITDLGGALAAPVTVRVYENAGVLVLADGEEPVTRKTSSNLDGAAGEFFLLTTGDVWTMTNVAVAGTQEYVAPMCDPDGLTPDLSANGAICEAAPAPPTDPTPPDPNPNPDPGTDPTPPANNSGGGVVAERDDGGETAAFIGGGMLAVGLASYFLWDGNLLAFTFSPDYGYAITESGYAYNVGGRLDFRQGDFHSYYAVGQANSDGKFGDFRYESGGEYIADLWTAAFSETVQGETADYDFSLSADYKGGIWRLSPTYRLHSHFDEEEFQTANSLNLEGVLRYNRWTISPSAGFNWESADEFGDNAKFGLSAVRRF